VQAIQLHVTGIGRKTTDGIAFAELAAHAAVENGGVARSQNIGQLPGLDVFNEGIGITDGGKRRVHKILVAEHADTAAAGNVPAGISADGGFCFGLDFRQRGHAAFRALLRPCRRGRQNCAQGQDKMRQACAALGRDVHG